MKGKILYSIFVLYLTLNSLNAQAATDYQDWWWNPALSGMGVNVGQQNNTLVVAWYHFSDDNQPTYLMLSGPLNGNRLSGELIRSHGPAPGPNFDPNAVTRSTVGTASIVFSSATEAVLNYDFEGKTHSLQLQRYTYSEIPTTGQWRFGGQGTISNCSGSWLQNGNFLASGALTTTRNAAGVHTMNVEYDNGDTCVYTYRLTQSGSFMSGSGTYSCATQGISGTLTINQLRVSGDFLTLDYSTQATSGDSCREIGKLGAAQ